MAASGIASSPTPAEQNMGELQTLVFTHNGGLSGDIPVKDRYRPFGSTDSETAFCWILEQLDQAAVDPDDGSELFVQLHRCVAELAERGTFNASACTGSHSNPENPFSSARVRCSSTVTMASAPMPWRRWPCLPAFP